MRRPVVPVLVMALLTAACGAPGPSEPQAADSLTVGFTTEPSGLDFTTTDGAAIPQALLDNVYEGLVTLDDGGRIVPRLARSWEVSADRRTYTFHLTQGVTFSSGAPFTADDAVFSIDRVKTTWTPAVARAMDVVEEARALAPDVLEVRLARPSNAWLYAMTTRVGAMFSRTGVENLATTPVGTGPNVVESWNRGDALHLRRRDDYWGHAPFFATATLRYVKDPTALDNALLTGAVDVIASAQAPESVARFEGDPRFQVIEGTTNGEVVLSFNNARPPFDDPLVRRAARQAIDRSALLRMCWAGRGTLIGSMVPPTDPWYEDLTGLRPYDPAAAKATLARSSHPDPTVRLRLPTLPYAGPCGEVVQYYLEQAGFDVRIDQLEFPAGWVTQVMGAGDYDASIVAHVEPRDLPTLYGNPGYYLHVDDPRVREAIAAADAGDAATQITQMRRAARLIAEDDASDWLFLMPNLTVADADVRGLPTNAVTESFDLTGLSRAPQGGAR